MSLSGPKTSTFYRPALQHTEPRKVDRTNDENGIAAALLNGKLYRLGILIAVVVLIAALALSAADGSPRPTDWNLTAILAGWRAGPQPL